MKRYGILVTISILLALAAATTPFAQYPPPDGSVVLPMGMGWFDDTPAWFVSTATTNISTAAAPPVFVTINSIVPQGPVFSTAPRAYSPYRYSGVWHVVYVAYNGLAARVPLTSEQQIAGMASAGTLSLRRTDTTVQYPIVVVGLLDDPLYAAPDVLSIDLVRAQVELPYRQYTLAAGGTAKDNSGSSPFDILMRMAQFPVTPRGTVLTDWSGVLDSPAPPAGTE
jgi:hypothetical protein